MTSDYSKLQKAEQRIRDIEIDLAALRQERDELRAGLPAPVTLDGLVWLVSRRPSDGAIFIGRRRLEFSEAQARRIVKDLLELLPAEDPNEAASH